MRAFQVTRSDVKWLAIRNIGPQCKRFLKSCKVQLARMFMSSFSFLFLRCCFDLLLQHLKNPRTDILRRND